MGQTPVTPMRHEKIVLLMGGLFGGDVIPHLAKILCGKRFKAGTACQQRNQYECQQHLL